MLAIQVVRIQRFDVECQTFIFMLNKGVSWRSVIKAGPGLFLGNYDEEYNLWLSIIQRWEENNLRHLLGRLWVWLADQARSSFDFRRKRLPTAASTKRPWVRRKFPAMLTQRRVAAAQPNAMRAGLILNRTLNPITLFRGLPARTLSITGTLSNSDQPTGG